MKTTAAENFLSSMDMSLKMVDHFRNALRDAFNYKWESETLIAVMSGIEDAYKEKNDR